MKCERPIPIKGRSGACRPCNDCLPCCINKRRVWAARIMLESQHHSSSSFVTLTYRDDALPDNGVSLEHHQQFMKNLRFHYGYPLRFYMCAEYGEKSFRAHYHYILFGYPTCQNPRPWRRGQKFSQCNCSACGFLHRIWGKGHVFIGKATLESANYCAGYVTKKMTKPDDHRLIRETVDEVTGEVSTAIFNPEFRKSSTRPGLAAFSVGDIVTRWRALNLEGSPSCYKIQGKRMPLGRFLKGKIDAQLETPPLSQDVLFARQMFRLLQDVKDYPEVAAQIKSSDISNSAHLLERVNAQRVLQVKQKFNRQSKGSI